jgi:hypothetical protein
VALRTVKPTGRTAWPRILLEGTQHSGKSWSVAELSASPKVGRTVVLVLGEDASMWNEYGGIAGARFELAVHDGTWASLIDIAKDARAEAQAAVDAGELPFVLCIDQMTAVWDGLKNWTSHRAANSAAGRKVLETDPDAKIDIPTNYWNDTNDRHGELMTVLLTFPGIVIMVARGGEVMLFEDGKPAKGKKTTWSVQVQKGVPSAATAHLRLSNDARPLLVSKKGVHDPIRPGIDPPRRLLDDWSLESVIFGTLGLNASSAAVGGYTEMQQDMTPEQVRDEAVDPWTTSARIKELYEIARQARYAMPVPNEHGQDELMATMLVRIGKARMAARQALKPDDAYLDAIGNVPLYEDGEKLKADIDRTFADRPDSDLWLMGIREALGEKLREIAAAPPVKREELPAGPSESELAGAAA